MRIKSFLVPLLIGTVFLSACKRDAVNLDYTNAKGEVPRLGNLVFRFNKSLVSDSVLNLWDSTEFISFEPKIPGRFRWESPDQLIFSPLQPLAGATTYKAKMNRELLRQSKYDKVQNADKMNFHTPDLSLDQSQVIWMLQDESTKIPVPQIDLYFNYRVSPDDLSNLLTIEVDGKKINYSFHTLSPGNKISVRLKNFKAEDKEFDARLIIDKGLKPEHGTNKTVDPIKASISIPSPFVLSIQNVEAEHDGTEGIVRVSTSQQLEGESLKSFLKFNPGINYSIEMDETGFIISSDKFDVTQSYVLTILKGLRGKIGGNLKEDITNSIAFGELEANIGFTNNKAIYLSKHGGRNTEVRITNVPKVRIVISKIYESNLLLAQRYGYYPKETNEARFASHDGEYEGDYYDEGSTEAMLGDVIYEKEVDTRSLPRSGAGRLLDFRQFEDRLPDFKGIYHVMIRSTTDYWVRDSRYISVSDIGIIAKEGHDKIFVFVNSLKTNNALDAVNIAVYGSNNQLVGAGNTNNDGVAEIVFSKKDFSGFRPGMIIAKTDDDFNYLPFNTTKVNTSRFEVGGKRNNSTGIDAFIYAERDIYRPGEKVNFSVILRNRDWKVPGDIPVKLKFLMPNGRELKSFRKNLNEQGSLEGNVDISSSAITGSYSLEVYSSNDVLLSSKNFMIEEFVPDRIKVDTKLDKPFLRPGESANLQINATNFFGPPAANRNYELDIQVKQKIFSSQQFPKFDFTITRKNISFDKIPVKEGKTDAEGKANEVFEVKAAYANSGLLQANLYATVFDETGRPVSSSTAVDIYTQDIFYGIQRDWFYYYPLNQPVKFQLTALNKEGKVVSSTARVHIIKHEYFTHLVRSGDYFRYESQENEKLMIENEITIGANTIYSYVPRSPGNYEIRIYRPGANSYVKREFYSYGSWGADNSSFEVNNEGHIDIEPEKENYVTGDNLKLVFKTPFSGKMLVTMETDRVLSYQYVFVEKRTATVDLKLSGEHLPNVYISATLIKPHELSDIPLAVAHGVQSIKVEEKNRKIPVEIVAQKVVRSRTHQKVKVKAQAGSYITLAAVDNGVLQVSNFETPDPYDYFYQKKALQVTAYDLYPLLFPEVRARLSSTGGDGELEMEKRVNPMPAKRVKIVSYWSGIAKANGSGEANFEFDVPQFSGEIRLMAVAYKNESFGTGEKNMTVADPIVISTALPRFLSPGDTINVPVTLSNTTSKSANVSTVLTVTPPLKILGSNTQTLNLTANSEGRSSFTVVAEPTIAIAKVSVAVNGVGEKFLDETEISIRPPSTLQKITGSGVVAGGKTQRIDIGTNDFIPGSVNYQLVVSRSPVLEIAEHLSYLVQYPYGCTEQTVSSAFPQLYYGDIADLMQLNKQMKLNANTNVLEAIRKIKMRQLYNGAVTLWDGEGTEDWWTTIYAAHFLLEAKKAGFDPDNSLIETMLGYIANRLKNKETIIYYYNRNQNKKIAPKEVAYGLYVLALAGRPQVSSMNYYKSNSQVLALDSKYLLSAAYAVAGDKKSFNSMLPAAFSGEESVPQTGGSYYSYVRDEAIALNALIDVDPGNKQIPEMAKHVSSKLKQRHYLNTQERAFSFLALGKLARTANKSDVTADIKVNGKTIAKVNGNNWRGDKNALKGTNIELVTAGSGVLYYTWQVEGISSTGMYKEEDNYIRVRRKFYDRYGRELTGNTFSQNDLVIVSISLENAYSTDVENVVITDLLPAGFEIENPRTKEIPGMDWIKNASTPTALDVRDDRIHFFVDLTTNKQMYYYAVRAVSPGQFRMGPVSADAMYNGEYHSYHGAGIIKVVSR